MNTPLEAYKKAQELTGKNNDAGNCRAAGMSPTYVSDCKTSRRNMKLDTLNRLLEPMGFKAIVTLEVIQ